MSPGLNGNPPAEGLKEATEKMITDGSQVVVVIKGEGEASNEKYHLKHPSTISGSSFGSKSLEVLAHQKPPTGSNSLRKDLDSNKSKCTFSGHSSPEINNFSPSHDKPSKLPTLRKIIRRSTAFSKPKSRFLEPPIPANSEPADEKKSPTLSAKSPDRDFATNTPTQRTPLVVSESESESESEDEYADEDKKVEIDKNEKASTLMKNWLRKLNFWVRFEWTALLCITGTLISSLTIESLEHLKISGLRLWKWCVLLLVIVCGRMFTEWFVNGLRFFIKKNFLIKKEVLYYLHGLRKSVQVCIWIASVLVSWVLLFDGRICRSQKSNKYLNYVTRALVSSLVGAIIWLFKTLFLTTLAASFHVNTFFDRIQESLFHQHVLERLSGPPAVEKDKVEGKGKDKVIDGAGTSYKLNQDKMSALKMKILSNAISTTQLFIISEEYDGKEGKKKEIEITCEWDAKVAARRIFKNVVVPGCKYIYKNDLPRFFNKQEVDDVFSLFEGAVEAGKIKKSMMKSWVVKVYREHKALGLSLNDALKAVKQLNKVASAVVLLVIVVVWLVLMELATTQVLIFISSQMFVYGHTAKVVFEGILFSFVMRPFDVGDRCVIDDVQMIVEEMSLLTTVFLKCNNEKIYYPNAVLATKSISNLYRSPCMSDVVQFTVDVSTTMESIRDLKARIKTYIESKPQHWNRKHSVVVLEIENVNKMKMALNVTHTMNHQNMEEKNNRKSDLVFELKKIFEELSIRYQLLPQEVRITYMPVQQQHQHQHQ